MIGGRVIEICNDPDDDRRLYINVVDRPHSLPQECAIYVERNARSMEIEFGDDIWWGGEWAYWTPSYSPRRNCGIDYDIKIPKKSYSGAPHPCKERM